MAVCDRSAANLTGEGGDGGNIGDGGSGRLFDPAAVRATADLEAFLATPGLEAVSVCTPTDTHFEVADAALSARMHVLIEKPVALDVRTVLALERSAQQVSRLCMPAMCMRFWPAWAWVKEAIDDGRYGRVLQAAFERLGARPGWGEGFYNDEDRSGGALFDLHVHDTDFVTHCFGLPEAVESVGDARAMTTIYRYQEGDGPAQVVARGGWMVGEGFPFRMRMTVEFEGAVADFDLGRDPELVVYEAGGETVVPRVGGHSGWDGEIAAFVRAVEAKVPVAPATLRSAALSTSVLESERKSLRTGQRVAVAGI